ncbi:MAG: SIR2 family protein [Deltaproteobacteria bacterium]|nr:SIR2 family protein [Deltaproteobacteria bacterium]
MSTDPSQFRDLQHVLRIRERLWTGRETGRAAVLVGAGFSCNAAPARSGVRSFPRWLELTQAMAQQMGRNISGLLDPLRIGSEYEAFFGRQALDELIQRSIPDKDYEPGELHKLLLALPWADVFTTNYDTLLERCAEHLAWRRYDLVLTPADIATTIQPRIVKLHGSFPSHRPYVTTEEDFRRYPVECAPFVNLVQESLIENVLCLIGFSGDDPNFLRWSGWVRDNMGRAAPAIYLCGVLGLTVAQERLLVSRNVVPIDLAPLFPQDEFPGLRHQAALEWFLRALADGAPVDPNVWPVRKPPPAPKKGSIKLPPLPDKPAAVVVRKPRRPSADNPLTLEEMDGLRDAWAAARRDYPGWVVCPRDNAEHLWLETYPWIEGVVEHIRDKLTYSALVLAFELVWRLETALLPLFRDVAEAVERLVNAFDPTLATPRAGDHESDSLPPDYNLRETWIGLALSLLRDKRRMLAEDEFQALSKMIEEVSRERDEWRNAWSWECALFYLSTLQFTSLFKHLHEWQPPDHATMWAVRRSGLLAAIGEDNDSKEGCERALERLRVGAKGTTDDHRSLSAEGWAMLLGSALQVADDEALARLTLSGNRDRWEYLSGFRCNPWTDINYYHALLQAPSQRRRPYVTRRRGFDRGHVVEMFRNDTGFESGLGQPVSYLCVLELSGVLVTRGYALLKENSRRAASRAAGAFPTWGATMLLLRNDRSDLDEWMDRVCVATLPAVVVERLFQVLYRYLRQLISHHGRWTDRWQVGTPEAFTGAAAEMLSRLFFRLSTEQMRQVLDLVLDILWTQELAARRFPGIGLQHLVARVLQLAPQELVSSRIDRLLGLPVPAEGGFVVGCDDWPEPFAFLQWPRPATASPGDHEALRPRVKELIRIVGEGGDEARGAAALRLFRLTEAGMMAPDDIDLYVGALWSRIVPESGLPRVSTLYQAAFLIMPGSRGGDAEACCRRLFLEKDLPSLAQEAGKQYVNAIVNCTRAAGCGESEHLLRWTPEEARVLLGRLVGRWVEDFEPGADGKPRGVPQGAALAAARFLERVVVYNIGAFTEDDRAKIGRIMSTLKACSFARTWTEWVRLIMGEQTVAVVESQIRGGLLGSHKDPVEAALMALASWGRLEANGGKPSVPDSLIALLVEKIAWRKAPELDTALHVVTTMIESMPKRFSLPVLERLVECTGLLLADTKLPRFGDQSEHEHEDGAIAAEDRPEYRALAAELAHTIWEAMRATHGVTDEPTTITKWREASRADPLPEVQLLWMDAPAGTGFEKKSVPDSNVDKGDGEACTKPDGDAAKDQPVAPT